MDQDLTIQLINDTDPYAAKISGPIKTGYAPH